MKQFKTESKKILDMMINSVYTNKDIFLREIISNASDALDKLSYLSLTDKNLKVNKDDLHIRINIDEEARTLTISDNGVGMNKKELEDSLGIVANSGSLAFKQENKKKKDIDIIGQFGVGFYSAFMVSDKVEVLSRSYNEKEANLWSSKGSEGFEIKSSSKDEIGTDVILYLKESTEEEDYDKYLNNAIIENIVKKYSDYITYPIKMEIIHSNLKEGSEDEYEEHVHDETLNSLVPLWKRNKSDIKDEEYSVFYQDKFNDYAEPSLVIHTKAEGKIEFNSLLFVPSQMPYDLYSKDYKKGLQLYSNGVLIMESCEQLLPDYLAFVKGVVDSPDLALNISREHLQENHVIALIKQNVENKVLKELGTLLKDERNKYESIYKNFGAHLKSGTYNNYGSDAEKLKDLLLFISSKDKKLSTFKEYLSRMEKKQDKIYYAVGESVDKIDLLPQVERFKDSGIEVLYLTDYVDEFSLQAISTYDKKTFANVSAQGDDDDESKEVIDFNDANKDLLAAMLPALEGDIKTIKFTSKLKNHPVCLTNEGQISTGMEKLLNSLPQNDEVKASVILEINYEHPVVKKLQKLFKDKKTDELQDYTKVLHAGARLVEGLTIENPTEIVNALSQIMAK